MVFLGKTTHKSFTQLYTDRETSLIESDEMLYLAKKERPLYAQT